MRKKLKCLNELEAFDCLIRKNRFNSITDLICNLLYRSVTHHHFIFAIYTAQVTRTPEQENSWQRKEEVLASRERWICKKRKIPVPQTTVENTGSVTQGLWNEELKPDWWCQGHARGSSWPTGASEVSLWSFVEVREEVVDVIVLTWHMLGFYLRKAFFCPLAFLILWYFTDSAIYVFLSLM